MKGRGNGLTREQEVAHVDGQLQALAFDLRQAHANGSLSDVADIEGKLERLLDWRNRLIPPQRLPDDAA